MLKSLIARTRLQLGGLRRPDIDALLAPAEELLEQDTIGRHSGSVAIFIAPRWSRTLEVDVALEPLAIVADRFEIAPLLPALERGLKCYVLTVGADHISLSLVTDVGWDLCSVPDLPRSVDETLWYEKGERHTSTHSSSSSAGGRAAIHHGSGAQNEDRKRRLGRFLRLVDDRVNAFTAGSAAPLVVAGTAPVVAIYEQVSRHARLIPAPIGSPEALTPAELHRKVDEIIDTALADANASAVEQLAALLGTGRASGDLHELCAVAPTGRIASLLMVAPAPIWAIGGDPSRVVAEWQDGAEDILNRMVVDARRLGAQLYVVDSLPAGLVVAGIYRH